MAARKSGLGRGLDALLSGSVKTPQARADGTPGASGPGELAIADLEPNPDQPRRAFEQQALEELAASIRQQGIIQPIVVRPAEAGRFVIVAGERRWRAARMAGLESVPVTVREDATDDSSALQIALVENLQRSDLGPLEEAEAYRELRERFGLSQEQIAQRVGKSRTAVANQLRLLKLPEEVRSLLERGELSAGQARPLLALVREEERLHLANEAVARNLSARDVETKVREIRETTERKTTPAKKSPPVDVHTRKATERLTRALQTKVEIWRRSSGRGGQVRIHFHSEDELMRIYEVLAHPREDDDVQE